MRETRDNKYRKAVGDKRSLLTGRIVGTQKIANYILFCSTVVVFCVSIICLLTKVALYFFFDKQVRFYELYLIIADSSFFSFFMLFGKIVDARKSKFFASVMGDLANKFFVDVDNNCFWFGVYY